MTSHLDDGRVVSLRDGDPSEPWDAAHVDACAECNAELGEARSRATLVAETLALLDDPVDVVSAKAAVRRRLDRERAPLARPRRGIPIGRAAAALLVTAGAAAALPWSPISPWRSEPVTTTALPTATTQAAPAAQEIESATSVAVDVAGPLSIVVSGAAAGSALELVWSDGGEARVAAPRGSSFSLGTGRVEVEASDGSIHIEAPRSAEIELSVNGRTYLERSAAGLTVSEPAAEVTDGGVRFLVRDR